MASVGRELLDVPFPDMVLKLALGIAEAQRLALIEMMLSHGAASALERLDAERATLAARQAVVQALLAERQNALLLYRVLGGGSLVPLPAPSPR